MKLKNVKIPPLLSLPGERKPLELTAEEESELAKRLDSWRATGDGVSVGWCHMVLRQLGRPLEMTPDDIRLISERKEPTEKDVALRLLFVHWVRRRIGLPSPVTGEDKRLIIEPLRLEREEGNWFCVSLYHHYLREVGEGQEITEDDRKGMLQALDGFRKEGNGDAFARMNGHMRAIGISRSITAADENMMLTSLDRMRRTPDPDRFSLVTNLLVSMRELMPTAENRVREPQMPPIKRIGE